MTRLKSNSERLDPFTDFKFCELSELVQKLRKSRSGNDKSEEAATALFIGGKGTGKSIAAEVLARELGLDLHRVDLSSIVSKYIGETEKNLKRVFDSADPKTNLLFFDEADALLGKRSDPKDAHDRYTNIETSYLAQRLEDYAGIAVIAISRREAIDPAFLRRIRFVVGFPLRNARGE